MNKKTILNLLIILIIGIGLISASSAYVGTGFEHQIPFTKYSKLKNNNILNKYNNTTCKIEAHGICTKVVDGDTIYVEGVGKIRFVGVNTPERGVNGYQTSKDFVKKLCLNKEVRLDIDNKSKTDRYGRKLAVVIVGDKKIGYKNLNEILLKENLAEIMFIPPSEFNPYTWAPDSSIIQNLGKTATKNSLTSSVSNNGKSVTGKFVASANSNKFHYPTCRWAKKISSSNKISFNNRNDAIKNGYQPCKVCNP